MNDEENPDVSICSLPHCDEPAGSGVCTGTTQHGLCDSCFCGYASSQFDALGAFTRERTNEEGVISAPGELPCYLFLTNECDCASLPSTTLARVLSTDSSALEAYESAKRRLIEAQHDEERAETGASQVKREKESSPVEKLHQVVVDALSRGGYVPCPECGQHGQKNDACMHMRCPCGTRYCYCCGRRRGDEPTTTCRSDGSGCDYPSPYLENHAGWNEFSLSEAESAGMGALHEFHRRCMALFLRQVKANYPPELWEQLRQDYPDLLNDVPTIGRRIEWDEIDRAEPPLFGSTTQEEIAWVDGGVHACAEGVMEEQQQDQNSPKEECPARPERQQERARHRAQPEWQASEAFRCLWIIGFVLAVILLSLRVTSESQGLRTVGNLLIALLTGTGLPILAMYAVDYLAANPQEGCIREVQCIRGRHNDLPYLAFEGRWSDGRRLYWFILFCGIALASCCLSANKQSRPFIHSFGVFLLTDILVSYSGLTLLVNVEEPPILNPVRTQFHHFMIRLCVHVTIASIGLGILAVYGVSYSGNAVGKVFFALGFAGVLAELFPRIINGTCREERAFTDTPSTTQLILSYIFCEGVAVGSLMIGISISNAVNLAGIIVLVFSLAIAVPAIRRGREQEDE